MFLKFYIAYVASLLLKTGISLPHTPIRILFKICIPVKLISFLFGTINIFKNGGILYVLCEETIFGIVLIIM